MKHLIYLILFISQFYNSFAQKYNFKIYGLEDGLVQSQIFSIIQDNDGYMWFGTFGGGVSKFNGQTFLNYNTTDGLCNNDIRAMMIDSQGNLWFGTREGISILYLNNKSKCYSNDNKTTLCIKSFTVKDGLPSNFIESIFEDSKGNIWIGTREKGISKLTYKSVKKKGLTPLSGDSSLSHPHLPTLRSEGNEGEWIFQNFSINNGLADTSVSEITEDAYGNIWIATDLGLSMLPNGYEEKLQKGIDTIFENIVTGKNTDFDHINKLLIDSDGNIWCGTHKGVKIFVPRSGNKSSIIPKDSTTYEIIKFTGKEGLSYSSIWAMMEDNDGNIWMGTRDDGLYKVTLDKERKKLKILDYFTTHNGLPENQIWSLCEDREGNIWIGTSLGGVARYSGKIFESFSTEDGLSDNTIWKILEDEKGNFWFRPNVGGLSIYDPKVQASNLTLQSRKNKLITSYSVNKDLRNNVVISLMKDRNGNIWVATTKMGVSKVVLNKKTGRLISYNPFTNIDTLADKKIHIIFEDNTGAMWFATYTGLYRFYKNAFTLISKDDWYLNINISTIIEDREKNIWVATRSGVSKLIPVKNKKETSFIFKNYTTKEGLISNFMSDAIEDEWGNIWLGSEGGISVYDPKVDTFYNFTTKDGLGSDLIYLINKDDEGYIWTGTNKGVDRISFNDKYKTITVKQYGKAEGFIGIETNEAASYKDKKGNLWFGTIKGVTKYNPKEDKKNTIEPLTHITDMRLFFEEVDWSDLADSLHPKTSFPAGLQLPYDQNHLTFDFIGISLTIPEKVKYQWKLEGFDKKYSPVTSKQEATYSNIPPGEYTFMVKACNNDGVWNRKPTTYKFTITPPFWQTWWFRVLSLASGVLAIMGYIKIRERNLIRAQIILEHKVNKRTEMLSIANVEIRHQKEEIEQTNTKLNFVNTELEKLAIVASKTDNGVIIADEKGNFIWVNEGFTRLTGYTLEEYIKVKGKTIMEASNNPEIKKIISKCIKTKKSVVYELKNETKDGNDIWVQTTLTPIIKNKKLRKLVAIEADITQRKEAEEAIQASILYAKHIQDAILPSIDQIKEKFTDCLIFFKPRDIVSGDFYWFAEKNGSIFIAAVDCTGHGVPGAFMSMIGSTLLNEIVNDKGITKPSAILDNLKKGIIESLRQKEVERETNDGMDIALCTISVVNGRPHSLQYAGAYNPLYLIRNNELEVIKADKMPVGIYEYEKPAFTNHKLQLQKGDVIYIFSDGYADQCGSKGKHSISLRNNKGKKFMKKYFMNLLVKIHKKPMDVQKEILEKTFEEWKGDIEQTDDILVIGIRI